MIYFNIINKQNNNIVLLMMKLYKLFKCLIILTLINKIELKY